MLQRTCDPDDPKRELLAVELGCEVTTVDKYLDKLREKLKVKGRVAVLHTAVRMGLVKCPCQGIKGYHDPELGEGRG